MHDGVGIECRLQSDRGLAETGGRRPVAFFFAATGGGVQKMRTTLANALVERGVAVDCVLPEARGPFLANLLPQVRLVDLHTRRPLPLVSRLASYLRKVRPVALVASQQHTILAALWARQLAGVAVLLAITQHNTLSELCRQSRRPAIRLLLPTLARLFFPLADRVTAVSRGVAEDLAAVTGIPLDRIKVIHNPVVPSDLATRAAAPCGHAWLDDKDRPVVLGAGNLIPIKAFDVLVRAFAHVRKAQPARLVILGDGPQRQTLEALAQDLNVAGDVDLPGFAPNPYAFMARADVFALASRVEGMPNVIIEALACGCPVVSTDCPHGPAELLDGGKYGTLVPVGDDVALAEAILAAFRGTVDRERLRARSTLFSAERAARRYLELLGLQARPEVEVGSATARADAAAS